MSTNLLQHVECGPVVDVLNKQYRSMNRCDMCHGPVSNYMCVERPGIGQVTTNSKPAYSYVQKLEDAKGGTCQNRGRGGLKTESLDKEAKLPYSKGMGAKVTIPAPFSRQNIHSNSDINTHSRGEFNTPTKRRLIQNENTKTLVSVFEVGSVIHPEGVGVEMASPAKRRKCVSGR